MYGCSPAASALRQPAGCEIASRVSLSVLYNNILTRDAIYPQADHSAICKRAMKHETSTFDTAHEVITMQRIAARLRAARAAAAASPRRPWRVCCASARTARQPAAGRHQTKAEGSQARPTAAGERCRPHAASNSTAALSAALRRHSRRCRPSRARCHPWVSPGCPAHERHRGEALHCQWQGRNQGSTARMGKKRGAGREIGGEARASSTQPPLKKCPG